MPIGSPERTRRALLRSTTSCGVTMAMAPLRMSRAMRRRCVHSWPQSAATRCRRVRRGSNQEKALKPDTSRVLRPSFGTALRAIQPKLPPCYVPHKVRHI
ncbi:hypothetical protein p1B274 (plasmid) [Aromatoleum aromaticum EbN1]|uniref:Uncharacterized protein n=1 Tax=Aromatoleum aromaticum (strain DSM 19018 / LMG 30748 / EbN1) TaxID=76114 RepID=Q5NWV6_AROAE|nr:hypothetical protein p1B274 [Aromatoleum aromaticum EbN1]